MLLVHRALRAVLPVAAALAVVAAGTGPASAAAPAPLQPFATAPDPLSRYAGQVSCDPVAKPGTTALSQLLLASWPVARNGGITRPCSDGGTSEHKEGRAFDFMISATDPAQRAVADEVIRWLTGPDEAGVAAGNARRLGVMYLIFDRQTWEAYRANETPGSGWKAYTGSNPHTDHIHLSLSWDGAFKRTSWWTGTAITKQDYGPCQVYVGEPAPPYSGPRYTPCPAPVPRPAQWWIRGQAGPGAGAATSVFDYGSGGDETLACDIDGDGKDSIVVYRAGTWMMRRTATPGAADVVVQYGGGNMRPVCGDWNGDGVDTIGVFDGTTWWLRNSNTPGAPDIKFSYGWPGAGYVVGDWNGDGVDTIGVNDGYDWWLRNSNTPGAPDTRFQYGWPGARLVVGDWNGDHRDGIGVFSGGRWWLRNTATPGAPDFLFDYGWSGVAPVAGRWVGGADGVAIVNGGA